MDLEKMSKRELIEEIKRLREDMKSLKKNVMKLINLSLEIPPSIKKLFKSIDKAREQTNTNIYKF
jgi:uncharacterized coiled-coil DUF342 family protein